MKKSVVLGVAFVAIVLGFIVYTTLSVKRYRCEVCVQFQGQTKCRIGVADTEMQARRTAQENACAFISSGVTDSMQCGNTEPVSVKWLSSK